MATDTPPTSDQILAELLVQVGEVHVMVQQLQSAVLALRAVTVAEDAAGKAASLEEFGRVMTGLTQRSAHSFAELQALAQRIPSPEG